MQKPNGNIINPTPPHPAKATVQKNKDHRSAPRFLVKWRAVAFIDEQIQHHGFIKDISVKGAALFLDRNLQSLEFIKLHIQIPPSNTLIESRILQVHGKVVYTAHDRNELLFRAGISFLKFNSEHDQAFLESHLVNFHSRIA